MKEIKSTETGILWQVTYDSHGYAIFNNGRFMAREKTEAEAVAQVMEWDKEEAAARVADEERETVYTVQRSWSGKEWWVMADHGFGGHPVRLNQFKSKKAAVAYAKDQDAQDKLTKASKSQRV
jgi:hypothetical protein